MKNNSLINQLQGVTVYDNNGISWDRYTVIIDRDVYGMSSNALSPQGFNQYNCDYTEIVIDGNEAIGHLVALHTLPFEVLQAIKKRFDAYSK